MTSPSIISDQEARQAARFLAPLRGDHPVCVFRDTGALTAVGATCAELRNLRGVHITAHERGVASDLAAYFAHHGERGPVEGWSA